MSQCKIYLENYNGQYYAGSEIRGRLECYFDEETTVRGIKVRLKCKEHNEWTGTETYTDPIDNKSKTRHVTLTGDHDVLSIEEMLFGSSSGSRVIPRGRHVYPFSFTLRHDIPSTFHGPHGSIIYKFKAVVDRPMRTDYEDTFVFVVMSPIDFNKLSKDYQEPSTYSDEKSVCCWCCKGGDITMDVELPKTGFVPGEVVDFKVNISNLSNSNVDDLKIKFTKTITYKVTSPQSESKNDVDNILSLSEHGVGAHGEHTYNLQLAIPEYIDVPNFEQCNLFKVTYALQVSCEMPACTLDLDISVWDIKMGHIKYVGHTENYEDKNSITPGFVNPSPVGGNYSPSFPANPYPAGGDYPPPSGGNYPPPGGNYPPSGGNYPPPGGNYPLTPGGNYPPPPGGNYPPVPDGAFPPPPNGSYPSPTGGPFPPSTGNTYPYSPPGGNYPPGSYSSQPPNYPSASSEKPVYPPGQPTAPTTFANAPPAPFEDNLKAREAASSGPSAPYGAGSELPPPSYNQIQQNSNTPYPPQ